MKNDNKATALFCVKIIAFLCVVLVCVFPVVAQDTKPFKAILQFNVNDDIEVIERSLGGSLLIKLQRINSVSSNFGWEISVVRKPEKKDSRNLLYHSRKWHGPYPTQIFAWNHKEQYFPDERILPVYGYPYEIRVRLVNIETKGNGSETEFVSGSVEIAWRRLRYPAKFDK